MQHRLTFYFFIFIILILNSITIADNFGEIEDFDMQLGPPADYPEADAIVISKSGDVMVERDKVVIEYHVRVKLFTKAGVDEYGEWSIEYYNEYEKIKNFKAHTITPDGKKHKIEKNSIFEKENNNWREKTFTFPALEPGCIIEYRYTLKSDNFIYLRPWYFQSDIYTLKSSFSVALTAGFAYDYNVNNVPPNKKRPTQEEILDPSFTGPGVRKIIKYTWALENLPPIKDEPYMSSVNDYMASLDYQLTSFTYTNGQKQFFNKTWKEVGEYQLNWFDDYCNKDKDVKKLAEQITQGLATNEEKSKALFEYVKKEFVTSDDYDNRFFKNEKMDKLLTDKTGSAEEKNLLLWKMHTMLDIESWPVEISTRSNSKFNPKNPSIRQFDYLITFVKLGEVWEFLDASRRNSIYGILPPECLTDGGLLIDKESYLVRMNPKEVNSYRVDSTRIYIDETGHAVCSTLTNFAGYFASSFANRFDRNTEEDFIDKYFKDRLDIETEIKYTNFLLDTTNRFQMTFVYETDDLVRILDENMLIKQISLAYKDNTFKSSNRFFPVDFSYPFVYQNICEIHLADEFVGLQLPEDVNEEISGASLLRSAKQENGHIAINHALVIRKPLFKPVEYYDIKKLFGKLSLIAKDEIALVRVQ